MTKQRRVDSLCQKTQTNSEVKEGQLKMKVNDGKERGRSMEIKKERGALFLKLPHTEIPQFLPHS